MLGNNGQTDAKKPWLVALEDGVITGLASFFAALIATGMTFPPTGQVVYAALIPAALVAVTSWAKARNIQR